MSDRPGVAGIDRRRPHVGARHTTGDTWSYIGLRNAMFFPAESFSNMKPGLKVGDVGRLGWTVDPSMIILLGGDPRAAVFSTPNMILLMERAAREAVRPFLEPGEESVGVDVQIQHVSGAGLGASVRGEARVLAIDGRRIQFAVEAFVEDPSTGQRRIGQGLHTRALVSVERLMEGLSKQSGSGERAMNLKANTGPLPSLRTLLVEIDKGICTVTLNRPRALNAVNAEMTGELEQVIAWLFGHPEEARVVLLRGAGDAFCAGDDVKELPGFSPEYARELSYRQAELYLALERLPQPVIALVHGAAFGGGCVAAYSADMRIARHDARFAMPEIKLGWPPGYGIAQLTALVGKSPKPSGQPSDSCTSMRSRRRRSRIGPIPTRTFDACKRRMLAKVFKPFSRSEAHVSAADSPCAHDRLISAERALMSIARPGIENSFVPRLDMRRTCLYAGSMSKMIQIRNVPESVHATLKSRAALAGQPLTDYLLAEIRKVAEHPTAAELAERLSQRPPARLRTAPAKAVRAERDRR